MDGLHATSITLEEQFQECTFHSICTNDIPFRAHSFLAQWIADGRLPEKLPAHLPAPGQSEFAKYCSKSKQASTNDLVKPSLHCTCCIPCYRNDDKSGGTRSILFLILATLSYRSTKLVADLEYKLWKPC